VERKKCKGTQLSVFKGREAKLNRAILIALTLKNPLLIYGMAKIVRMNRDFRYVKYTNINRRVRVLQEQGYIEEAGSRKTQAGPSATLCRLTNKAHVALLFHQISRENFINEASEKALATELAALTLFLEVRSQNKRKPNPSKPKAQKTKKD
jgi:hypothetical protein